MLACLNGRDECLALLIQFGVSLKVESKGDAIKDAMLHASYYSDESSVAWNKDIHSAQPLTKICTIYKRNQWKECIRLLDGTSDANSYPRHLSISTYNKKEIKEKDDAIKRRSSITVREQHLTILSQEHSLAQEASKIFGDKVIEKMIKNFTVIDFDRNGTLNEHEIEMLMMRAGHPLDSSQIEQLLSIAETMENGEVTLKSLMKALVELKTYQSTNKR